MKRFSQLLLRAFRALAAVIGSFALWTLWLALVLLLALQLYVASAHELALPRFVLRELESRLADYGIRATFQRTAFDPTGRVLVENVQLSLPAFPDPVVRARSVYLRLNPWMLVVGRIEPREIRVVDASAAVPAMLSPTGRPAEIVTQLDATLEPQARSLVIHQLSARVAGVVVSAHGTLVPARRAGRPLEEVIGEFIRNRFTVLCRQALEVAQWTEQLDHPQLHLELSPSASGAAAANLTVLATGARIEKPARIDAIDLRARTHLLLFGDNPTSWIEFTARELQLPGRVQARNVQGDVYGRFQDGAFFFEPRELTLTADEVLAAGVAARALSTQIFPRPLPRIDISAVGRVLEQPLGVRAQADLQQRHATAAFEGEIAPDVLAVIGERLRVDVRKYFDFTRLVVDRGEVRLGEGWKFQKLDARVRVDGINAYGVPMTDGRVVLELDPQRFYSPEVSARLGENFARGSYEQDLRSLEYRFLLQGRLRPIELSPWFRDWWPAFFRQLEFPVAPPAASVDVRGQWKHGDRTSVFVFADAGRSIVRDTEFDRVRTRLFIRPGFYDTLELSAARGAGLVRGRFLVIAPPGTPGWETIDLAFDSSLDLPTLASIAGRDAAAIFAPFSTAAAPTLNFTGHFTGPGSPQGPHQELRVEARTRGEFRFHGFPLPDASFVATLKDDELTIDDFEAQLAGGVATGHARVWGSGDQQRLGFDFSLAEASLGRVVGTVQEFFARKNGQAPTAAAGKFVQEKANVKLGISASAEGLYRDPLSFRGDGSASLRGPEIAEIPLLGALSKVLEFTALRITEGSANFKIEGPKIVFPQVKFLGPSAAIDAHGNYALGPRTLDFQARIYPFQESENLIKTVVGAVLTPLSNVFEVKLTGSLEKPDWAVTVRPTNLFRSGAPTDPPEKPDASRPPKADPSPTSPPPAQPPSASAGR